MLWRIIIPVFFIFSMCALQAQDMEKIEQCKQKLQRHNLADTSRIQLYIDIANEYRMFNKDSALRYINKGVKLAREKNDVKLSGRALYTKATVYYFASDLKNARNIQLLSVERAKKANDLQTLSRNYNLLGAIEFNYGNYKEARKYYDLKLSISSRLKDTSSIIESYYNIALIYNQQGNYKNAIDYEYRSLRLAEEFRDSSEMLYCSQGLGETYFKISDYSSARFFLEKARKIAEAKNDRYALSGLLIDEGNIYQGQEQWDSSIFKYDESIAYSILSGDRYHHEIAVNNKATSRREQKKYRDAIMLYKESERIGVSMKNKPGLIQSYMGLAESYLALHQLDNAYQYAQKAKKLSMELRTGDDMMSIASTLARIFEEKGRNDSALYYFKLNAQIKDTISSSKQLLGISEEAQSYEKDKIQQARAYEKKISDAKIEKQQQIRNIFIVFSTLILVVLAFLFRNVRQKQKANKEIVEQKKIIEHKNKDILDSINYSRRIQNAILTPNDEVRKLLPRSFVLFRPKDIVSGDFYFIEPVETTSGKKLIALAMADCTGHGVPGAFMSIMAYNFLKQSLKEKTVNTSGEALDYVNRELKAFLRQHQSRGSLRDGMDIAFCAIDDTDHTIDFAGANNPLWILSRNKPLIMDQNTEIPVMAERNGFYLYEIKATKQHVGYNENTRSFASHRVKLQPNDTAILFTDGYADQFGGPAGKKIKSKKFAELILENAGTEVEELGKKLESFFDDWKSDREQVDDVSVIAYRV